MRTGNYIRLLRSNLGVPRQCLSSVLLLGFVACASPFVAYGRDFSLAAECRTRDQTRLDGQRDDCTSAAVCETSEIEYIIVQNSIKTVIDSYISSGPRESTCSVDFYDFVEVIPGTGITQPRKVCLTTRATSPSGAYNGNGFARCILNGKTAKIQ